MYFFNVEALKHQLRDKQLTQAHALSYLVALLVLWYLPIGQLGDGTTAWDEASFWASLVIMVSGTVMAYHANGGAQGEQFLERFISLSWVVFWRILPMLFLLAWLAVILHTMTYGDSHYQLTVYGFGFSVVAELLYYQRLCSHLRQLNGTETEGHYVHR